MTRQLHLDLSRRERQIIDILYANGRATAAEVQALLPDPPSYSAVRAMLRILEDKGHVRHEAEGRAHRYFPVVGAERAGGSALARIRDAIFHGSAERMFAQLVSDRGLGREELEQMRRLLAERIDEES